MLARTEKSGISQVANARVQSRGDIKAEKVYGPNSEKNILFASSHIYGIMGCDRTNKDNQEEENRKQAERGKKPTARIDVPCHIVPPMVLQHSLLLGRP